LSELLKPYFARLKEERGKSFGDPSDPLLVKIVVSPNLAIVSYPTLHNYGLTADTLPGFNKFVGEHFGVHEVQFLLKGNLELEAKLAELEKRTKDLDTIKQAIHDIKKDLSTSSVNLKEKQNLDKYLSLLPKGFFDDPMKQIEVAIKRISKMLVLDELDDNDTAIIIQPMVYGNFGKDSSSGNFYTRNIVMGEKKLQGEFYQEKFDSIGATGQDIVNIGPVYLAKLEKIARTIEDHFKEIRYIRFTIENKELWLIEQRAVEDKSTQADIRLLLELHQRKLIDDKYAITGIKVNQLYEILHPIVDITSTKKLPTIKGGISGAPGAAIGRVFFSTEGLLEKHKMAQLCGEDTRFILCD
jgi:pyruvate,orthophosphate dikinase